jgi:predicted GNAT family acetyltransferase
LSLVPIFHRGKRIYLIANVAVHPEHRRRGIARALTKAALDKSRRRQAQEVWLHAREDNPAALNLYTSMGFKPQTRRSLWTALPRCLKGRSGAEARVTIRSRRHWDQQRQWLTQTYPPHLQWHLPLKIQALKPGLWGFLYRFFSEVRIRHWAAQSQGRLLGVLTWQESRSSSDHLWLAAPPETEGRALQVILPFLRGEHRLNRPLSLDYPADRANESLLAAGFEFQHTLIWMNINP